MSAEKRKLVVSCEGETHIIKIKKNKTILISDHSSENLNQWKILLAFGGYGCTCVYLNSLSEKLKKANTSFWEYIKILRLNGDIFSKYDISNQKQEAKHLFDLRLRDIEEKSIIEASQKEKEYWIF